MGERKQWEAHHACEWEPKSYDYQLEVWGRRDLLRFAGHVVYFKSSRH